MSPESKKPAAKKKAPAKKPAAKKPAAKKEAPAPVVEEAVAVEVEKDEEWLELSLDSFGEYVEPETEGPLRGDGTSATEPIKKPGHHGPNFSRFADQF